MVWTVPDVARRVLSIVSKAGVLAGVSALATGVSLGGWVAPDSSTCPAATCAGYPSPRTCGDHDGHCMKYTCSTPADCESNKRWEYSHEYMTYYCTWDGGEGSCYGDYNVTTKTNTCCNFVC